MIDVISMSSIITFCDTAERRLILSVYIPKNKWRENMDPRDMTMKELEIEIERLNLMIKKADAEGRLEEMRPLNSRLDDLEKMSAILFLEENPQETIFDDVF
jgi:hypothetical protein